MFVLLQKGIDEVGCSLFINQCIKRMSSSKGVPKRENGVVIKTFTIVNLVVSTSVLSLYILIDVGSNHLMLHRCIEIFLFVFIIGSHFNFRKLLIPKLLGIFFYVLEIRM